LQLVAGGKPITAGVNKVSKKKNIFTQNFLSHNSVDLSLFNTGRRISKNTLLNELTAPKAGSFKPDQGRPLIDKFAVIQ
jgi:hypothetical protein